MVPDHNHGVAVERRRGALAEAHADPHVAEVAVPQQVAVHVVAEEAARPEEGADHLAVGHRRPGRPAPRVVPALVRLLGHRGPLPDHGTVAAVDGHDHEVEQVAGSHRAHEATPETGEEAVAGAVAGAGRDRRQEEQVVPPDDGRRLPEPGNLHLPADVLGLTPARGRIALRRGPGRERTAPLRPIEPGGRRIGLRGRGGREEHQRQRRNERKKHETLVQHGSPTSPGMHDRESRPAQADIAVTRPARALCGQPTAGGAALAPRRRA